MTCLYQCFEQYMIPRLFFWYKENEVNLKPYYSMHFVRKSKKKLNEGFPIFWFEAIEIVVGGRLGHLQQS